MDFLDYMWMCSQHKGSSAPSVWIPVVNEERSAGH